MNTAKRKRIFLSIFSSTLLIAVGLVYPATITAEAAFGARYAEFRNRALAADSLIRGDLLVKLDLQLAGAYESTIDAAKGPRHTARVQKIEAEFARLLRDLSGRLDGQQRILGARLATEGARGYGRLVLTAIPGSGLEDQRFQTVYFGYRVRKDGSFETLSGLP